MHTDGLIQQVIWILTLIARVKSVGRAILGVKLGEVITHETLLIAAVLAAPHANDLACPAPMAQIFEGVWVQLVKIGVSLRLTNQVLVEALGEVLAIFGEDVHLFDSTIEGIAEYSWPASL